MPLRSEPGPTQGRGSRVNAGFGRRVPLSFVAAAFVAASCGSPQSPQNTARPEALVLRVDGVTVQATRPGTNQPWDGPTPEDRGDRLCSLMSFGVDLLSPVAGKGASLLCGLSVPKQEERDASNPDLRLRLSAGNSIHFDSPPEPNVVEHVFGYEFVVPVAAIPADGLLLEVRDVDTGQDDETIGSLRLLQGDLLAILESPTHLRDLSAEGVAHLELVVTAYQPVKLSAARISANQGPVPIGARKIAAGEIVTLQAEGQYTVGAWYDQLVQPSGYPGGAARSYNFEPEPFRSAPHACGIALAGENGTVQGALVAPSVTFESTFAGPLRVGINDSDPSNNKGWISFRGVTRAPTPAEWAHYNGH